MNVQFWSEYSGPIMIFFAVTAISICNVNICNDFYIVVNLIHAFSIMWTSVFEIQYDDAYVLIKNISLRI